MSIKNIDLGLCCINTRLRAQKPTITCNRTCRLKTANEKGVVYIQTLVKANLRDVLKILQWNVDNNIKSYRLSSDMFPHFSNPSFGECSENKIRYNIDFAKPLLHEIGKFAIENHIRLSFHPGQYNQIASPSEDVFKKTVLDLYCHAVILDTIEENHDFKKNKGILCIHGGGTYNDKEKTIQRWVERFDLLPDNVKNRIAIENCEKGYSSEDCIRISKMVKIPHIFDIHHYNCYNKYHPAETQKKIEALLPDILQTWSDVCKKPYFHISEQGSGKCGHHSDFIEKIPKYMFDIGPVTLDVEAKAKEEAILKLVDMYNNPETEEEFRTLMENIIIE